MPARPEARELARWPAGDPELVAGALAQVRELAPHYPDRTVFLAADWREAGTVAAWRIVAAPRPRRWDREPDPGPTGPAP